MRPEYIAYLKSEHWRNLRCEAIERWGDRCSNCSVPKVDVHHLRYGTLYDVTTDDLMPLCRRCHDNVHQSERLRDLLASEETSDFKRKTVVGYLAGRDEVITKKVPFQTHAQVQGELSALQQLKKDAESWRQQTVRKKMSKHPEQRPQTYGEKVEVTRNNYYLLRNFRPAWHWMRAVGINPQRSGWQRRAIGFWVPVAWIRNC